MIFHVIGLTNSIFLSMTVSDIIMSLYVISLSALSTGSQQMNDRSEDIEIVPYFTLWSEYHIIAVVGIL